MTSTRELLAKLSPEDQVRAMQDVALFGTMYLYRRDDGSVELLNPTRIRIADLPNISLEPT